MMYSTYLRIERKLGGLGFTRYQFLREAIKHIDKPRRHDRNIREIRQGWLRNGLEHHDKAMSIYKLCKYGV